MHHIDEHTIELYILGSDLVKEQIAEIEAHFKECYGCRSLAEQVEAFYQDAGENLDKLPTPQERKSDALMRLPKDLIEQDIPLGSRVPYMPATAMAKFWYFVYKHPIPSAVSGFAAVAAMVLGINYAVTDFMKDKNPAYSHINLSNATVEIYNKENQLLWGFPSNSTYRLSASDLAASEKKIVITDLDGDQRNEVVTTLQVGKPSMVKQPVTFFSYFGKTIREVEFSEQVQFRGAKYEDNFRATDILCEDFEGNGKKEIFTIANSSRSPHIIYRLSSDGKML
ncbi:MAG: hypothetical protein HY800_03470, partial [Ignavibacteriales bacterium]|nr:hypothetical protein [Ignavibacteriales bacterium]